MAGELEEIEVGERGETYPEYVNLDPLTLDSNLDALRERSQLDDSDTSIDGRITYIENLQRVAKPGEAETSLDGGEERTVTVVDLKHDQAKLDVARFIKEKFGVDMNWGVDESNDLNNKISLSEHGNVQYSRMGDKGKIVKPQIVLEKKEGVLDYNKSNGWMGCSSNYLNYLKVGRGEVERSMSE